MRHDQLWRQMAAGLVLGTVLALPNPGRAQGPATDQTSPPTALAGAEGQTDTQQAMLQPSRIITPKNTELETIAQGQKIFNGTCSHCHGPDAVISARRLDLRQLQHRYGETAEMVFDDTVNKGRPSKGMPSWSQVFTEDKFRQIYAYLSTIQSP